MVTTNGVFLVDSLGKLLVAHPTNHDPNFWSIPKGLTEEGETSLEAAFRETKEETGLDLQAYINRWDKYEDLGEFVYRHKKKKLHAHLIVLDIPLSTHNLDLVCTSMFVNQVTGLEQPENDITKWVDFEFAEKYLHYTQQTFIKKIKNNLG